ncbi:MAG: DNA-3-methyladenine glycosylase family protein [Phototrophicaceae bacterium]
MILGEFSPPAPYDFGLTARLMGRYHGVLDHYTHGELRRALRFADGQLALLGVRSRGTPDAPLLEVSLLSGEVPPLENALQKVEHLIGVGMPIHDFYTRVGDDAAMQRIIAPLYGLHHFQSETVFEALVQVIIEQQISLKSALRAQAAIAEWGGQGMDYAGEMVYAFPTPKQFANATPDELHAVLKITRRRVALIQHLAQQISDGALNLEALHGQSSASIYQALHTIKGIGHWTIAWTLLRGLNRVEYAGHNDVALRDAVGYFFLNQDARASVEITEQTFARYTPYSGLAAFYTLMHWATLHY